MLRRRRAWLLSGNLRQDLHQARSGHQQVHYTASQMQTNHARPCLEPRGRLWLCRGGQQRCHLHCKLAGVSSQARVRISTKVAHEMSEVSFYHQLQSLSCASGIPGHHWIAGHHLTDRGGVGVNTLGCDLSKSVRVLNNMKQSLERTRYAKSLAVKMPLNPSSSSTTRTQSVLFAAQS